MKTYYKAPWDVMLSIITFSVSLLFILFAVNQATFWTITVAGIIIVVPAFFVIRGYSLEEDTLIIYRLGWIKKIDLTDLRRVEIDHKAMKGSWRLLGNGGLFGYIGTFRSKRLGTYRAYATHRHKCVVLEFDSRKLVISPDRPSTFTAEIQKRLLKI